MAIKVIILFALITIAAAVPVALPIIGKQIVYADTPAEYTFNYAVNDGHTGDVKSQHETRKGDYVVGQYTLIDADGYQRIVDYTADEHNGFNAVVRREPLAGYKKAPVIQKTIISAPITKLIAPAARYISTPAVLSTKVIGSPRAHYTNNHAQVSFNGPAHSYHY